MKSMTIIVFVLAVLVATAIANPLEADLEVNNALERGNNKIKV